MTSFLVSDAAPADYPAFARLFPELGVVDPVPSAQRFTEIIAPQSILARDGEAVVGFAWSRPRGERLHIVNVITDPANRRRGVGRALMHELAKRARAAGFQRWMLRVKPENLSARKLYEGCGMRTVLEGAQLRVAWDDLGRLPSPPAGIATATLTASEDARFERALQLEAGDLSSVRALPGRVFMGAAVQGVPVGCVAFDPAFPGAPVLRARSPSDARALLEALVPHALPPHAGLFVSVEGDPALESALVGVGAEVTMRMLRMEGNVDDAGA